MTHMSGWITMIGMNQGEGDRSSVAGATQSAHRRTEKDAQ